MSATAARAREALALPFIDLTARDSFVDEELAPRAIPERIYARKPCASAYERPPARSLTFGKLFPAAAAASKSRRPKVAAIPRIEAIEEVASCFGPNPLSPKAKEELIVAVACQESTRAQGVTLEAERTKAKSAPCRGAPHHAWFSVSRAFVRS